MRMTLKKAWRFGNSYGARLPDDVSESGITLVHRTVESRAHIYVPAGIYDIERIECPQCPPDFGCKWLVIKGTLVGMEEGVFRRWEGADLVS